MVRQGIAFLCSGSLKAEERVERGLSLPINGLFNTNPRPLGVKLLCTLTTSFDPNLWDKLPTRVNKKGVQFRNINIIVEMRVSSGELCWSAKHNGVDAGSVTTAVGYEGISNT